MFFFFLFFDKTVDDTDTCRPPKLSYLEVDDKTAWTRIRRTEARVARHDVFVHSVCMSSFKLLFPQRTWPLRLDKSRTRIWQKTGIHSRCVFLHYVVHVDTFSPNRFPPDSYRDFREEENEDEFAELDRPIYLQNSTTTWFVRNKYRWDGYALRCLSTYLILAPRPIRDEQTCFRQYRRPPENVILLDCWFFADRAFLYRETVRPSCNWLLLWSKITKGLFRGITLIRDKLFFGLNIYRVVIQTQ